MIDIKSLPLIQDLFQASVDPVYVVDSDYNILWANQAFLQLFSYRLRQRKLCYEVTDMEICRGPNCLLWSAISEKHTTKRLETMAKGGIESQTALSGFSIPIHRKKGKEVVAVLGLMRDMSNELRLHTKYQGILAKERERKEILEKMVAERTQELVKANEAISQSFDDLERSRRAIADILQNIRQAIITIDVDQTIGREYSRYSETIFGSTDFAGKSFPEFIYPDSVHQREHKELKEWLKLVFDSRSLDWEMARRLVQTEYRFRRPDGKVRELVADIQPIYEKERIIRLMFICDDVTAQRAMQRDLDAHRKAMNENLDHLIEIARLDPEIYKDFLEEAFGTFDNAKKILSELRDAPDQSDLVTRLFREMHTLKGNAMSFGLVRIAAKAHWVEDAFSALRNSEIGITEEGIHEAEEKVDELRRLFEWTKEMADRAQKEKKLDRGQTRTTHRAVKVEVEHDQIQQLLGWIDTIGGNLDAEVRSELRTKVRQLTMIPIGRVYKRFPKMVNDLAEQLDKNVQEIELDGGECALEPNVFNKVADSLVHMVRNAVDHGVEPAHERLTMGKPAFATIGVKSYFTDTHFCIDVADDGRGLNFGILVQKALEKGIISPQEMLDEQEALQLIFRPNFSTAGQVTEISGRGVGMDVVKDSITSLQGEIYIDTEMGRGTTFKISIPREVALGDVKPKSDAAAA